MRTFSAVTSAGRTVCTASAGTSPSIDAISLRDAWPAVATDESATPSPTFDDCSSDRGPADGAGFFGIFSTAEPSDVVDRRAVRAVTSSSAGVGRVRGFVAAGLASAVPCVNVGAWLIESSFTR